MSRPDLTLRPAVARDAPALADLFLASRRAAVPSMPAPVHPPDQVHAWFAEQLRPETVHDDDAGAATRRELWVADRDAFAVGYLILDPEWLDSLYVDPDLVGHGIGTALLDLAKSLRPGGFGLWVFESNLGARRFYSARGLLSLERTDGRDNEEKAPDIAMVWPGHDPLTYFRRRIDAVDTDLGKVLARRAALTAAVQRFKPVSGQEGRDREREAEIAARLAAHAPNLGAARIERIIHAVITESLDAAEQGRAGRPPPVGGVP